MNVLHIIDSGGMYGAEVMLLNLLEGQIQQGLKPVIASIGDLCAGEKPLEVEARRLDFPVKTFRMRSGPNLMGTLEILNYAKSIDCSLLHSHGYKGNILLGFIPKIFRRLPIITTVHGWTSTGTTFSRMRLYEWLDAWTLSRMDAVVLVSKEMLVHPRLARRKNDNFHIVNNGISLDAPEPYPCEELTLRAGEGFNIIAVGRLSPEKGFDVLLKAIARVVEKGLDVSLVLFGEGRERSKLEQLVSKLGLFDRVNIPGFFKNVATTFPCFNLLVMPSFTEGLPITLLEAMRGKLPIIASKVGGIPNLLEGGAGGILVEPGNETALAEAIIRLAGSQVEGKQFAKKAHLIFEKNYSLEGMAAAYQHIYADMLTDSDSAL